MAIEEQNTVEIEVGELCEKVSKMYDEGYRLVQIGCGKYDDIFEINYSFEKDYRFENLRISVAEGVEIPSVSDIYWGSFVYENEIHDLFGISVTGININYDGTFVKTSVKNPFNTPAVTKVKAKPKDKKSEAV